MSTERWDASLGAQSSLQDGEGVTALGMWALSLPFQLDATEPLSPSTSLENELDLWAEHMRELSRHFRGGFGAVAYLYNFLPTANLHQAHETYEIYGRLEFAPDPILLGRSRILFAYNSGDVLYLEGGTTLRIPLWKMPLIRAVTDHGVAYLTGTGGGRLTNKTADDPGSSLRRGREYLDWSLTLPIVTSVAGPGRNGTTVTYAATVHLTKVLTENSPDPGWWFGVSVTFAR